ncbi:MAG: hypothetical protein WCA19_18625 [Candidatus Acidiferrales bacterium]
MIDDRRAYKRLFLHSQVEISGVDESGLQFAERARVEDVSDLGCRFSMRGAVHEGSILGVEPLGPEGENLSDEFPRLFVVIWVKRKENRLAVGARSLREEELSDAGFHSIISASKLSAK